MKTSCAFQIGDYENFRKSRRIELHSNEDLNVAHIVSKGRYALLQKGFLQKDDKQITVMVKSANGNDIIFIYDSGLLLIFPGHFATTLTLHRLFG